MLTRIEHKTQNFKEFQEFFGFSYTDGSVEYYINNEYSLNYSLLIHPKSKYIQLEEPLGAVNVVENIKTIISEDNISRKRLESVYLYNIDFANTNMTELFSQFNTLGNSLQNLHVENCLLDNFPIFSVNWLSLKFLSEDVISIFRDSVKYKKVEVTKNYF